MPGVDLGVGAVRDRRVQRPAVLDGDGGVLGAADDQGLRLDARQQATDVHASVEVDVAQGARRGRHVGDQLLDLLVADGVEEAAAEAGHGHTPPEGLCVDLAQALPQREQVAHVLVAVRVGPTGHQDQPPYEVGSERGHRRDDRGAHGEAQQVHGAGAGILDDGDHLGRQAFDGQRSAVIGGAVGTGQVWGDDGAVLREARGDLPPQVSAAPAEPVPWTRTRPGPEP
ncbi:hypothetical protein GCM10020000_38050 [Streptomyces olivoverticillatus]